MTGKGKRNLAHILIVDDQAPIRELISEELADEGYHVTGVGDVQGVWRQLNISTPDLVLLDLYLDGVKGWDLLRDIKERDPNLPVLIVTAYDSFAEDPRLSQADGYVIKSFVAFDHLKEKIAEVLQSRKNL